MTVLAFPIARARRTPPITTPSIPPSFDSWLSRRIGRPWAVVRDKNTALPHLAGRLLLLTHSELAAQRALYTAITGQVADQFEPLSRDVP